MPSFLSTGLLIFSRAMANFGVAAQLALPVGSEVLTTRIYKAISELNIQSLSVLSLLLIAISYTFYFLTEKWIKRHAFYGSGSGRTSERELMALGKKTSFIYPVVFAFFLIALIFPLVTLALSSFMKRWGLDVNIGNMTLNNYKLVLFQNDLMRRAFSNSLFYGTFSACVSAVLAIIIVYFYRHVDTRPSRLLMSVSSLPLSVPNIILAVGAIFAWINPPLKLYGTKWIIILTYIILFTPIIVKQIKGLSENIEPSADLSARTLGISVPRRILRLFLPRVFRGAMSGWIISFLIALREIPISLLLYSKGNETVGVLLFTVQSNSYGLEMTSTVAVLIIIISIIGNILVNKLCEKRFINENIATE
jgi:iron(III) transport system permease protein